jgi:phosphohistidine swiveling domain-containing protein
MREGREFFALCERLHCDVAQALASAEASLVSLLARAAGDDARWLAMVFAMGTEDLEITKPALAFAHVVEIARRDPSFDPQADIPVGSVPDSTAGPMARAWARFIEAFGDLVDGDAELARPRWREDPSMLVSVLRAALRGPSRAPEALAAMARTETSRVRADVDPKLSFVERRLARDTTSRLEELLRMRSRLRVRIAHARSMMRTIILEVDGRLGRLDSRFPPGGAFDCRWAELERAVGDYRADRAPIAHLRRGAHVGSASVIEPLDFRGTPSPWPELPIPDGAALGIGVSPGAAVGRVRFVGKEVPEDFIPGDIALVECADLGHGPLMLVAGAVVSELGNPWSDGGVLARSLARPMVSGIAFPRWHFVEGERVRVDGSRGRIERLEVE